MRFSCSMGFILQFELSCASVCLCTVCWSDEITLDENHYSCEISRNGSALCVCVCVFIGFVDKLSWSFFENAISRVHLFVSVVICTFSAWERCSGCSPSFLMFQFLVFMAIRDEFLGNEMEWRQRFCATMRSKCATRCLPVCQHFCCCSSIDRRKL